MARAMAVGRAGASCRSGVVARAMASGRAGASCSSEAVARAMAMGRAGSSCSRGAGARAMAMGRAGASCSRGSSWGEGRAISKLEEQFSPVADMLRSALQLEQFTSNDMLRSGSYTLMLNTT